LLINLAAKALARRADLADLLVGVTGDFVPARAVLKPTFVLQLIAAALQSREKPVASALPAGYQIAQR
jgi:hypothetical protein